MLPHTPQSVQHLTHRQMHPNLLVAIAFQRRLLQKLIPLIINELSAKTHENTGNKPAKPEMITKLNMTKKNHKIPVDSYKKAQPLMVPFDAEEESSADKL